jgi:hypothetical protein
MMDYANRALGMPLDRSFIDTVEHCGLYWTLDGICLAAARPSHINRDEAGHLHCEVGPAIAYPSGWASWHWHGIKVPQIVVETPERITAEMIDIASVSGVHRIMMERYQEAHSTGNAAASCARRTAMCFVSQPNPRAG